MKRCIVTYAEGLHEELLEVARPGYEAFALRHKYDLIIGEKITDLPPAWNKIPLLIEALQSYEVVVWFDCDLIIVNGVNDFPPLEKLHQMVRHFEDGSEVPNSGVWRLHRTWRDLFSLDLLREIMKLEVFRNHGWWEQAALLTLMGYTVPPEGSDFRNTRCKKVADTKWYNACQFLRLSWNSHPNYRAETPRIVHCSYPDMNQRLEVMRELVRNPTFHYPRYDDPCPHCKKTKKKDDQEDTESKEEPPQYSEDQTEQVDMSLPIDRSEYIVVNDDHLKGRFGKR